MTGVGRDRELITAKLVTTKFVTAELATQL